MFGKMISDMMVKPGKPPVFETPDQYHLNYEDVSFTASDGVTLSGWLIKGGTDKVIIQSHFGVQCSRCGFTQEGKGMMKNVLWTSDIPMLSLCRIIGIDLKEMLGETDLPPSIEAKNGILM